MAYDVFISHSHKDKNVADAICHYFEESEIKCWIAPRDITPGANWAESIADAIPMCRIMLLIFSSSANMSHQVLREVELAVKRKLIIVPLKIDDVNPTKGMEYYLSTVHWVDVVNKKTKKYISELTHTVKGFLCGGTIEPQMPATGLSTKTKSKKITPVFWISAAALLVVMAVLGLIFRDEIFEKDDTDLSASPTLNKSSQSPTPSTTQDPTPEPEAEAEPEEPYAAFIYNSEDNTMKIQLSTDYSDGIAYVNKAQIEADIKKRIDGVLEFYFNADLLNVYDTVTFSVVLKDKYKEDMVITWSNYFFCFGEYDLSGLSNYPNLEYLYLSGEGISGNIDSVSDKKMLKRLEIHYCPNVEGDIKVIEGLTELTDLGFLDSNNITGDIGVLTNLSKLKNLDMQSDSFSGELESIGGLGDLEQLYLGESINITGEIGELSNLPLLKYICINNLSGINGDIAALDNLGSLAWLYIIGADGVEGDVASFAALPSIGTLYLGECNNIYGNIESLNTLPDLKNFKIKNCPNIEGRLRLVTGETIIANE